MKAFVFGVVRTAFAIVAIALVMVSAALAGFMYALLGVLGGRPLLPAIFFITSSLGWLIALIYVIAWHTGKTLWRTAVWLFAILLSAAAMVPGFLIVREAWRGRTGIAPALLAVVELTAFGILTGWSFHQFLTRDRRREGCCR